MRISMLLEILFSDIFLSLVPIPVMNDIGKNSKAILSVLVLWQINVMNVMGHVN